MHFVYIESQQRAYASPGSCLFVYALVDYGEYSMLFRHIVRERMRREKRGREREYREDERVVRNMREERTESVTSMRYRFVQKSSVGYEKP